ncbi:ULK/ULK protein kinase [Pseudogymnoascus sp. 05NY08]|nr:ULK/ULK protein kinase [Pseudogymnoascus sp. 05NY08]
MAAFSQSSRSSSSRMNDTLVGAYRIDTEIGKGSFATTTRALVAIKSVNLAKLNRKLKENLNQEIDILQSLQHPHIVALLGRHQTETHIHLVMEYCELGDLSLFIRKRSKFLTNAATEEMARKYPNPEKGGLNEVISVHFLKQLASALEFLRDRNFIHRDVKPQNMLLLPSPQYMSAHPQSPLLMSPSVESLIPAAGLLSLPMLKLADFGFARSLPAASLAETLCGSPLYMAPEILRYEKYDAKADLWSVGTVMYEMVTGKPPFRAANHVELLRKIEMQSEDLPWDSGIAISDGLKSVIQGLLKKNPVERLSFDNFFAHPIIVNNIQGLVGNDRPEEIRPTPRPEEPESTSGQFSARSIRRGVSENDTRSTGIASNASRTVPAEAFDEAQHRPRQPHGTPPRAQAEQFQANPRPSTTSRRPVIHTSSTVPNKYPSNEVAMERRPSAGPVDMVRGRSQDSPSPGSSLLNERKRVPPRNENLRRDEKERAAQDVRDEREYIVVEKNYVEVNSFADELDANARAVPAQPNSPKTKTRERAQTEGAPSTNQPATSPPISPSGMQIAQGKQNTHRKSSYDRSYGSPSSATSAITKAISNASLRLFGISGYAPQLLRGQSPPQIYGAFTGLPTSPGIAGMITDGKPGKSNDEDAKIGDRIEALATRSDVVYGFAEVKYKQLIPLAPSMDHGLGGNNASDADAEDDGLTPDAIVSLSEEALVLYVKSLTLLAKSMGIANSWWNKKKRAEAASSATTVKTETAVAAARINSSVQWMRSRFNEVLEKAEFSRLKLIGAQKQLPEDHPGHPSNHTEDSRMYGGDSSTADGVCLSAGTTAERLMYDRAIEMSRSAAINEIANEDLAGCELSYVTAIRMLEAILEKDDDEPQKKVGTAQVTEKDPDDPVNGINVDDRDAVKKLVAMVKGRLLTLRRKLAVIAKHKPQPQQQCSRPSSNHSGGTTPTITNTPPKQ